MSTTTPNLTLNNGVVLPALADRISENIDIFDFTLATSEVAALDALGTATHRSGLHIARTPYASSDHYESGWA